MNIILLGAPGEGKGTQATRIEEEFGLTHVSTGDIFRRHMRQETPIGKKARSYIKKGQLVPDEVTIELVRTTLEELGNNNFMLDGFPRNINQAEALGKTSNIDCVIDISVDFGVLMDRICGRRSCLECGYTTHISVCPDGTCPKCGSELVQRMDDKEETVKQRLEVYKNETAPLVEYYTRLGKLRTVNGMKSPDEVFEEIKKVLK